MYPMYLPFGMMLPNPFKLQNNRAEPPTIYSILNSYVNFANDNPAKIKDLAKNGRTVFFDFDYPLTENITKEYFECMILNKFMMYRIGFETVTAFKLQLQVKLNEIMPIYNKLFDALEGWNIFTDGENISRNTITSRTGTDVNNSSNSATASDTGSSSGTSDRRNSDTPQNNISDVRSGNYVSDYSYDQNTGSSTNTTTSSGSSNSTTNTVGSESSSESISRTPSDKIRIYREFIEARKSIFTMIFEDLDDLFYKIY